MQDETRLPGVVTYCGLLHLNIGQVVQLDVSG